MRKETVEQKVYQLIKNAILRRQIAPGNQLFESAIAAKVNASRTPIRSAISKLEAEGLVDVIPNKGAFIVQPTMEEMIQAFEMRKVLEEMAIREGYSKLVKTHIALLKSYTEEMSKAFEAGDMLVYHEQNKTFHLIMANASGNRYLIDFMERILNQITIYMILYDVFRENDENDLLEHHQMIQLIEKNDKERLLEVVKEHLNHSLTKLENDKHKYQSLTKLF
ncbi:FCD domain-containing protein [Bacillus hwajinpoensis]|uniref:FCD domain-containing protein n=1 Tax=Guptibacillus hwajinpoensis TaxID=208199 RepID=A0A845EZH7_9BACL|nr:GntR family transcriptional regulator [Pseudalkalibacillus hwajinpoensis]MYL63961.1 FCD domain-containing protein [Pseudalkalibacillus hwajinpoensis]